MYLVLFVGLGAVVGLVAHEVAPAREPGGWLSACLTALVGAVLGGWLGRMADVWRGDVPTAGVLPALLFSVAFAAIERALARRRALR